MLLILSQQEIDRLYKLSQDKVTIEALKKIFLNHFINDDVGDVQFYAASYLSTLHLESAFKAISNLQPKETIINKEQNMV